MTIERILCLAPEESQEVTTEGISYLKIESGNNAQFNVVSAGNAVNLNAQRVELSGVELINFTVKNTGTEKAEYSITTEAIE